MYYLSNIHAHDIYSVFLLLFSGKHDYFDGIRER